MLSPLTCPGTALLYTGIEQIEKASNQAYEALNDQTTEPGYTAKKEKVLFNNYWKNNLVKDCCKQNNISL